MFYNIDMLFYINVTFYNIYINDRKKAFKTKRITAGEKLVKMSLKENIRTY